MTVTVLWIMQKAREATRRSLLVALKAIKQNDIERIYEDYLKTMVFNAIYASIYTCICR